MYYNTILLVAATSVTLGILYLQSTFKISDIISYINIKCICLASSVLCRVAMYLGVGGQRWPLCSQEGELGNWHFQ